MAISHPPSSIFVSPATRSADRKWRCHLRPGQLLIRASPAQRETRNPKLGTFPSGHTPLEGRVTRVPNISGFPIVPHLPIRQRSEAGVGAGSALPRRSSAPFFRHPPSSIFHLRLAALPAPPPPSMKPIPSRRHKTPLIRCNSVKRMSLRNPGDRLRKTIVSQLI